MAKQPNSASDVSTTAPAPAAAPTLEELQSELASVQIELAAIKALLTGHSPRVERIATFVVDTHARLACLETGLGNRKTPMAPEVTWPNVSISSFEIVRNRTREIIDKGE